VSGPHGALYAAVCRDCGARDINETGCLPHDCGPNVTGFRVGDPVIAGGACGVVRAIRRNLTGGGREVQVYFRSNFGDYWYPLDQVRHESDVPATLSPEGASHVDA
jgi:hypothetical protein